MNNVNENDWKLFLSRIGQWQENFMDKLLKEYRDIIDSDEAPSERFWKLEKRIKQDKRLKGVQIELTRKELDMDLAHLYLEGVITMEDLDGFSDEVKDFVRMVVENKLRQ